MIDHLTLTVRDLQRSRTFYERALAPLGYSVRMELDGYVAFGDAQPVFWLKAGDPPSQPSMHLAFAAKDRAQVDGFYSAAVAAGGKDNGAPGLRADYHPDYYGAFVFDLDGHNIEAVCHVPATPAKPVRAKTSRPKSPAKRGSTKKGTAKRPVRKPARRKR